MSTALGIFNTFLIFLIICGLAYVAYIGVFKKDNYLNSITSPINNVISTVDSLKNALKEDKPYILSPSTITFDKNIELKGALRIGEKGKYSLLMDINNNLTLNKENIPLLKFIDINKNNDTYVDTKLCFNDDCSKYLNINKLYGITTNQEIQKVSPQ